MDELRKKIKDWLKETGMSRQELANKCFVKISTINNWLSTLPIPPAKLAIIENLMQQEAAQSISQHAEKTQWKICSCLVSHDEYKLIAAAAALDGLSVEEWCAQELTRDAEARMQTSPAASTLTYREKRDLRKIRGLGTAENIS